MTPLNVCDLAEVTTPLLAAMVPSSVLVYDGNYSVCCETAAFNNAVAVYAGECNFSTYILARGFQALGHWRGRRDGMAFSGRFSGGGGCEWDCRVIAKERFEEGLEPGTRWQCLRAFSLKSVHELMFDLRYKVY
jgi:hypothetical protein